MDKNILDITVDLETLSKSPSAAIIQIAAVAWRRSATDHPVIADIVPFVASVDLRSCIAEGFDVDMDTVRWWCSQSREAKEAVLGDSPAYPINDVLTGFADWVNEALAVATAYSVCLWSQGSDFDIPVLRNAFARFKIPFPVPYFNIRDCRTLVSEVLPSIAFRRGKSFSKASPEVALKILAPDISVPGCKHDPLHDATLSTLASWAVLRDLNV